MSSPESHPEIDSPGTQLSHFGPLLFISVENLLKLATRIRKDALGTETRQSRFIRQYNGEYNINHIIQLDNLKLVIRVPASGWGAGRTLDAVNSLKSQVATLRFLEKKAGVPAPRAYHFHVSAVNEIGAPYVCTSYIEGESLGGAWFDDSRDMPLEERRLRTLSCLAGIMARLAPFMFDKIGSLVEDEDEEFSVGSSYPINRDIHHRVHVTPSGPYST